MQNNIKNEIGKLMQKDMDRKDFLKHVGIGFAGIMGITAALKTLSSLNGSSSVDASAYGGSTYGGVVRGVNHTAQHRS
jgi:hypothetical protein